MRQKRFITIPQGTLNLLNLYLSGENNSGEREGDILFSETAIFDQGFEADIKLVVGDPTPYVDAVLFENGEQVTCLEPEFEKFNGEYIFKFNDGKDKYEFIVIVQPSAPGKQND